LSLAVVAIVAVAGAAIAESHGWPFLRGPLQRTLERAAGVRVDLGGSQDRFVLKLLGRPSLDVAAITLVAAPGPAAPHLLSAQDLHLVWRWSDVWRGWRHSAPLRIESLRARTLDLNLLRDASGHATWQIGRGKAADDSNNADLPGIGMLTIGSGRIVVDDRPLATQLLVTIEGGEGDNAAARANTGWRAKVEGQWKALPMQLAVVTGRAMPLVADTAEADIDLRIDGQVGAARVAFDGRAGALLGARRLEGALKFGGPSLDRVGKPLGVTLPQTPPFDLEGRVAHDAGLWKLSARRATIGKSRLAGEFVFDTRLATPKLSGQLTGQRLAFSDLGPAVGASPSGTGNATQPKQPTGRVLPQRSFDLPSLRAMDADVQVSIDELDFGTAALAPLRNVSTSMTLAAGLLELQQIKAVVAGGNFSGSSSYDGRSTPPVWAARVRLAGVDIAGWLRGTQTPQAADAPPAGPTQNKKLKQEREQARQGGQQVVRNYVTGALEAALDVRGSGKSTGEILSTLNGNVDLTLRDGTLSHLATEAVGLDLAQGLGVIVRGDRPLPLRCARLQASARNGIVRTDRGVIDNADTTVRVAGELNLKDESLALVATARPKDFSPLSLRTPITVRGTLAKPVIGVDGGKLAGKVGAAAALGVALGPFAALIPLLDFGNKSEGDACATSPPAAPSAPASGGRS
jgi:AsmA family protein